MTPVGRGNVRRPWLAAAACLLVTAAHGAVTVSGQDARYLEPIPWEKEHFGRILGLGYSELGLERDVAHAEMRTVDGTACAVANIVSFDVDDDYAFNIDEPVELIVTYAPAHTTASPFMILWDQNGDDGHGVVEIEPEPGATFRRVMVTLDRARLAGLGALGTDLAIGARRGLVALCDIAIARSGTTSSPTTFGRVQLGVRDEDSGRSVPARVGIYDATGRAPLPSGRAIAVRRFTDEVRRHWLNRRTMWPSVNRQAFYIDGSYEARLPVGTYELAVTRGPEYRAYHGTFEVRRGETADATVVLERYQDLPARGWYSGDSHIHLHREQVDDLAVWGQVAAEDVHVANLLEMGNIAGTYFRQPEWGKNGQFERDGYILVSGQEDPRTGHRGHTIHWNVDEHRHVAASAFYKYHEVFEQTRQRGAITGYAHLGSLFNGRRGLALDVPFGLVDFIEVLQGGRLTTEVWYDFLNLGFRVLPVAGADYPYFGPTLPGVERTYVKVDGGFDAETWFESFRRGRTYVTNGPFLEVTVNGRQMGEELRVERGAPLTIQAEATLNPDIEALTRLELVVLGDVVHQEPAAGQDRVRFTRRLSADHSMWIAVRAYGEHEETWYTTVAHSAPIYVIVEDEPTWKADAVPALVREQLAHLEQLLSEPIDPLEDLESFETHEILVEQWDAQRPMIAQRVEEATERYQRLLDVHRNTTAQP